MKKRKELRVDVSKGKSITGMVTGRKEAVKKGTTDNAAAGKVNDQIYATRRSYSEAVIEAALRTERVYIYGRHHFAKDRQDIKQRRRCCCLSSGR